MYDLGGDPFANGGFGGRRRPGFGFGDIMDAFFGGTASAAGRGRAGGAARTR